MLVKEVNQNMVLTRKWSQEIRFVRVMFGANLAADRSRSQSRREPLVSHARHDQAPQAPPPAPRGFSGSNSIPIGTRKGQNNGQLAQPPPGNNRRSGPQLSGGNGNVESMRNRSTRGVPLFDGPVRYYHLCSAFCKRLTVGFLGLICG